MNNALEVFQELTIEYNIEMSSFRNKLISQVNKEWVHDVEREGEISDDALVDEDVIVFNRAAFDDIDESYLILWQYGNQYKVTNIVPRNSGELGIRKYNIIINDFLNKILMPMNKEGFLDFNISAQLKTIDSFLDESAADALMKFSRLANKSTKASHPLDQERWLDFLIKAHRSAIKPDASEFMRWLCEICEWPDETASDLAIEYEFSLSLLNEYDKR
ncbi:hypothetical protein KSL88_18105 [Pectobacterium polaris]|uniref:hypothetical protein n=1 Tax=Pectobacterium polaris TaxID=2042057 RepID=UPI001CC7045A|nr:hypothetical protein [Pectobacterium polaris]UAY91386.1 hypothetical protein KSL88_18105 [Pectobacterium polaris]